MWVGWLVIVQSVEECCIDQVRGPDHRCRPDKKPTNDTSHTEANHLGSDNEKHLKAYVRSAVLYCIRLVLTPSKELLVKHFLGKQDVRGVCCTSSERCICHNNNDCVFFHVKWVRIEAPFIAKCGEGSCRHNLIHKKSSVARLNIWNCEKSYFIPSDANRIRDQLDNVCCD
jgi:hypothetical protein